MLTTAEFKLFRIEVKEALSQIADKYDSDIEVGRISYTHDSFKASLEVTKKPADGKSFEQSEFEKYCKLYLYNPEDYNAKFIFGDKHYRLIGFNPKARKYSIIGRAQNGKSYGFARNDVKIK